MNESLEDRKKFRSVLSWLLRGLVAINLFRLSQGWSTEFEGDADHPGVGTNFGGGFRSDFNG